MRGNVAPDIYIAEVERRAATPGERIPRLGKYMQLKWGDELEKRFPKDAGGGVSEIERKLEALAELVLWYKFGKSASKKALSFIKQAIKGRLRVQELSEGMGFVVGIADPDGLNKETSDDGEGNTYYVEIVGFNPLLANSYSIRPNAVNNPKQRGLTQRVLERSRVYELKGGRWQLLENGFAPNAQPFSTTPFPGGEMTTQTYRQMWDVERTECVARLGIMPQKFVGGSFQAVVEATREALRSMGMKQGR